MKVIKKQIMDVHFDPSNVRKHNAKNLEAIKASLARFGQQKPIVLDGKDIVRAGNGTLEAARELGWSEIDCVYSELEGSELTAFAIADNRTAELAEWDVDSLSLQLKSFDEELRNIAYDEFDFLDEPSEPSEKDDAIPDVVENEMGVELGDLWELGSHRLLCGDSTDKAMVDILMGGEKADMVFTDPPYGVDYQGGHHKLTGQKPRARLANDTDVSIYGRAAPVIKQFLDGPAYIWFAFTNAKDTIDAIDAIDAIGSISALLIWNKTNAKYGALNAHYKQRHEPCLYVKCGKNMRWCGPTDERTVWDIKRDPSNDLHPTQKPVELAERAIRNHKVDIVLDLFLGSGSTLIACEKTGRKCYGSEIDPHYCSVIIKRWEEFTGKKARRLKV